jgi:hypothetical protein
MKYWVVEDDDEEEPEETKYSNILQEEEYEEEDDPPVAFKGLQKGSSITDEEFDQSTVKPWDPSEVFFVYI